MDNKANMPNDKLYGILEDDDPYCASYTTLIFTSLQEAKGYILKNVDNEYLAGIEVWKYDIMNNRYCTEFIIGMDEIIQ